MNNNYTKNKHCFNCDKLISDGAKRCNLCAHKIKTIGKNNSSYIDGRTLKKYYCVDCKKEISYKANRCRSCSKKGKKHPLWHKKHNKNTILKFKQRKGNLNGFFGKKHTKKTKDLNKIIHIKLWHNKEYIKKTTIARIKGLLIKPNKPEKILGKLLKKILPNEYKYNKTFIISGLIPDFVNKKRKKIIELYGDYWHNRPEVKKRDKNRIGIYELFANYKTLIVWQNELKNLNKLKEKILKFHYGK